MKRATSIVIVLCLLLAGCATTHQLELDKQDSDRLLLVKEMSTDAHGRPVPGRYLKKRPTKIGKRYTAVLMQNGLPVRSFDIGITTPGSPDFAKPFVVLGTYTAAGIVGGVWVGVQFLFDDDDPESDEPMSDEEARGRVSLAVITTVVGTAVGLVVGVVKGVTVMAEQVNLLVLRSDETLLGYSEYEYDAFRRLSLVRRHAVHGSHDRIVTTKYLYEEASDVPASSETFNDYVERDESTGI